MATPKHYQHLGNSVASKKLTKVLSEQQQLFLEALFSEAEGDPRKAMNIAGYSKYTTTHEVLNPLREEVLALAKDILLFNAPKAATGLIKVLNNPGTPNAKILMDAAKEVLNRTNIVEQRQGDLTLNVPEGSKVVILPAKELDLEFENLNRGETREHDTNYVGEMIDITPVEKDVDA